jgi:hypothetical protein
MTDYRPEPTAERIAELERRLNLVEARRAELERRLTAAEQYRAELERRVAEQEAELACRLDEAETFRGMVEGIEDDDG